MRIRRYIAVAGLLFFVVNLLPAADKPADIRGGNGITLPPPPPTKAEPVTETVGGQTNTDP